MNLVKNKSWMKPAAFSILFLLILALTLLPCGMASAKTKKATKPRLSRTSMKIRVRGSKSLVVKNVTKKVKWKVSNKKLISIKTKGKLKQKAIIKAKKRTGKCYVIARVGKKKLKCKITVLPKKKLPEPVIVPDENVIETDTTRAIANTSVRLLSTLMELKGEKENVLISPDSILTAMAMVENGASGETLSEMEKAFGNASVDQYNKELQSLHKRITSSKYITCKMANAVWYNDGVITLKEPYLNTLKDYYGAAPKGAPFDSSTVDEINQWVADQTNQRIKSIIDQLDPQARMVLANAVYFKGLWTEPYTSTVKRTFTNNNGNKKEVPMLESTEDEYLTVNGGDGFVKYYEGGETAFIGLLPPKGTSPAAFLKTLKGADLIKAYKNRLRSNVMVYTRMPEFSYEYSASMKETLMGMGIQQGFTDGADFSGMCDWPLKIDDVLHKTFIKLDKDGTEAAGATAVIMKDCAAYFPGEMIKKTVYLDRPFIYGIIDTRTGLPLFLGIVETL